MSSNFVYNQLSGSGGYQVTTFNVLATELNSVINGAFSAPATKARTWTDTSQSIWGYCGFRSGGAFQANSGSSISVYWLNSPDGGTTFESYSGAAATGVLARQPDAIIPFTATQYFSGQTIYAPGLVRLWPNVVTPIAFNNTGATLAAGSNTIFVSPIAVQY